MIPDDVPTTEPHTGLRAFVSRQPWLAMSIGIASILPFTAVGMLLMAVQGLMRRDAVGFLLAAVLAAVTVAGGVMGGLAWLVAAPLRRRGNLTHDLSWAFVVYAYLLGVFAIIGVANRIPAITRADDEIPELAAMITTPAGIFSFLVVGLVMGFVLGRSVRGSDATPRSETPLEPRTQSAVRIGLAGASLVAIGAVLSGSMLHPAMRMQHYIDRGMEHQQAERWEEALREYDALARIAPDDAAGHHGRGWALFKLERFDESIAAYETAVRLWPGNASIHTQLAAALGSARRYEESVAHAREAIRLDDSDEWAHRILAEASLRNNDRDDAVAAARDALRLDPQNPQAHNTLARALLGAGRYDEAEDAYREALERRPDWAFGWVQLARLAHQQRNYALADSAYTRVEQLAPDVLARAEVDQEMWREVREALAARE